MGYVAESHRNEDNYDDSHSDAQIDDLVVNATVGLAFIIKKEVTSLVSGSLSETT